MKKLFFLFVALIATMGVNAQQMEVFNGDELTKTYQSDEANRVRLAKESAAPVEKDFIYMVARLAQANNGSQNTMTSIYLYGNLPSGLSYLNLEDNTRSHVLFTNILKTLNDAGYTISHVISSGNEGSPYSCVQLIFSRRTPTE